MNFPDLCKLSQKLTIQKSRFTETQIVIAIKEHENGGNVMAEASKFFPQFGADIKEVFSLPKFYENFDVHNGVINQESLTELNTKIENFKTQLANQY